jgi:hypothetical protein
MQAQTSGDIFEHAGNLSYVAPHRYNAYSVIKGATRRAGGPAVPVNLLGKDNTPLGTT